MGLVRLIQRLYHWWWADSNLPFVDTNEPHTFIMRRNPWILMTLGPLAVGLTWVFLPVWATVTMAFSVGLVCGHVHWGSQTRHSVDYVLRTVMSQSEVRRVIMPIDQEATCESETNCP